MSVPPGKHSRGPFAIFVAPPGRPPPAASRVWRVTTATVATPGLRRDVPGPGRGREVHDNSGQLGLVPSRSDGHDRVKPARRRGSIRGKDCHFFGWLWFAAASPGIPASDLDLPASGSSKSTASPSGLEATPQVSGTCIWPAENESSVPAPPGWLPPPARRSGIRSDFLRAFARIGAVLDEHARACCPIQRLSSSSAAPCANARVPAPRGGRSVPLRSCRRAAAVAAAQATSRHAGIRRRRAPCERR